MDVLICNFPPMWTWYIPAAPAILSGACTWLGLTSDFIDFAILNEQGVTSPKEWAVLVTNKNPKLIAFSLFSYLSKSVAAELAQEIKKINPNIKIIAGGAGIKDAMNSEDLSYVTDLINVGTVDYYIDGDGEYKWPNFLIKFFNIDIKQDIEFDNLQAPYLPDYSKYNIAYYRASATKNKQLLEIPITGSRGCVRKCTFCEIHEHWKFSQRTPEVIAAEIRHTLKTITNGDFCFNDSLVNGSLPTFNKILDQFVEIKKVYPAFSWSGQFIIRSFKQCNEEYWKKIADSGCSYLAIGVETGSDRLRFEMKKNFSNEDLTHSLYYMNKFNIKCVFLMFVGYPTETAEDFAQTVEMFNRYQKYANNTIKYIQPGWMFTICPGAPIYQESKKDSNMILSKNTSIWYNKNNPTLTYEERIRRRKYLEEVVVEMGYAITFDTHIQQSESNNNFQKNQHIIKFIERQK